MSENKLQLKRDRQKYFVPAVEVIKFDANDIIATSGECIGFCRIDNIPSNDVELLQLKKNLNR